MKLHILVTGASKGIGAATAKRFLTEGHSVIVCSRSEQNLAQLASECSELNGKLYTFPADVSHSEDLKQLSKFTKDTFSSQLDILVHNAGVFSPGEILEIQPSEFKQMMDTNFWSAQELTHHLTPLFKQHPCHIINISSIAALDVYPGGEAYGITKAAMTLFSKSLRKALIPFKGKVTTIYPGATYTDSWSGSDLPEDRFIPVEDIAEIIYQTISLSKRTVVEEITLRPLEGDI